MSAGILPVLGCKSKEKEVSKPGRPLLFVGDGLALRFLKGEPLVGDLLAEGGEHEGGAGTKPLDGGRGAIGVVNWLPIAAAADADCWSSLYFLPDDRCCSPRAAAGSGKSGSAQ